MFEQCASTFRNLKQPKISSNEAVYFISKHDNISRYYAKKGWLDLITMKTILIIKIIIYSGSWTYQNTDYLYIMYHSCTDTVSFACDVILSKCLISDINILTKDPTETNLFFYLMLYNEKLYIYIF